MNLISELSTLIGSSGCFFLAKETIHWMLARCSKIEGSNLSSLTHSTCIQKICLKILLFTIFSLCTLVDSRVN
jgi:hypothetical protein